MTIAETLYRLKEIWNGSPWIGPNVLNGLLGVTEEMAGTPVGNSSIKRILAHMSAWRVFFIEAYAGNVIEIEIGGRVDWPPESKVQSLNMTEWIDKLSQEQEELEKILLEMTEEKWQSLVPGKPYTFRRLANGLVDHDIYHLGQINFTASHLKRKQERQK